MLLSSGVSEGLSHPLLMETQQQLQHGEVPVLQQLPPTADQPTENVATSNGSSHHDPMVLNYTNSSPSYGGSLAGSKILVQREEKASGDVDYGTESSPPPTAAVAKDGGLYDPECGTSMKKPRGGGWITTPFIFGAEAAERLAMTGAHVNLMSYLVNKMHQRTLPSATTVNTFTSTSGWAPLLGAFVADAYLGRYATILYASFIYSVGLIVITMSAVMPSLQPAQCVLSDVNDNASSSRCVPASSLQMGVVYVALSLMVVGSGGIRPCVCPFGASQFDQNDPKENAALKSYFNWYFFSVTLAGLVASTVIVYIQDNVSWGWGFGISAAVMLFSMVAFLGGSFLYRYSLPRGSAFTRMAQVLVAAVRKRHLVLPSDSNLLYFGNFESKDSKSNNMNSSGNCKDLSDLSSKAHDERPLQSMRCSCMDPKDEAGMVRRTGGPKSQQNEEGMVTIERERPSFLEHSGQFRILDKAAIELETDWLPKYNVHAEMVSNEVNPWRLCPVRQVEELKSLVRLAPMWASGIVTGLATAQGPTYLVQQARTMNRDIGRFNIPPASINVMSTITVIVWLPLFDRYLIPKVIAPRTGHPRGFTFLQKIGIGYALHLVAGAISILVEHERRVTARKHGFLDKPHQVVPFSVFTLVPQEVVGGIASCFGLIGHCEFYYHMVPEHITSTASAISQTAYALGVLLASGLLNAVQSVTASPGHPGWLDENLNKAHLDYFYLIILIFQSINFTVYICFVSKWYKKQLMGN